MIRIFTTIFLVSTIAVTVLAQDDLLNELEKEKTEDAPVIGTFNGTRLINGHSVETKHRGALEFIITHRFGKTSSGGIELWGLDESYIRLGLEYGITDKLGVGIGRSSFDKTFDYYVKYKALEQRPGIPVTVSVFGSAAYNASRNISAPALKTGDKMAYTTQLLVARKFSSRLSLQLMPTYLFRATVTDSIAVNNLISLGMGGRVKLTKSMAVIGEYYLRLNEKEESPYFDSFGLGVEFETGGHVFQLIFTNSIGMVERAFVSETGDDFFDGDIHFGFNITRTFQLGRKK